MDSTKAVVNASFKDRKRPLRKQEIKQMMIKFLNIEEIMVGEEAPPSLIIRSDKAQCKPSTQSILERERLCDLIKSILLSPEDIDVGGNTIDR